MSHVSILRYPHPRGPRVQALRYGAAGRLGLNSELAVALALTVLLAASLAYVVKDDVAAWFTHSPAKQIVSLS